MKVVDRSAERFFAEQVEQGVEGAEVKAADLYAAYAAWFFGLRGRQEDLLSANMFGRKAHVLAPTRARWGRGYQYNGVRLRKVL